MKKTILFLLNDRVSYLPPFQSLIDFLLDTNEFKLIVISSVREPDIDKLYFGQDIEFIHFYDLEPHKGYLPRLRNKFKTNYIFKYKIKKIIESIKYDVLWVIHEYTGIKIADILKGRDYILSSYELKDKFPKLRKQIKPVAHSATINVACEINRAWMMKVWYELKDLPFVMPNKPYCHPRKKFLENELLYKPKEKVILYQGIVEKQRNLDGFCAAASKLNGYKLAIMGPKSAYLNELLSKYKNVEYIGFAKSPFHLKTTSNAYIGIVTYAPDNLNCVYCAPNKIWEYAGFGIPMLANEIPGLQNTVERAGAAICTNMDDVDSIIEAIKKIEENYEEYCNNANNMYDNSNLKDIIYDILKKYENKKRHFK